jgi:hypothetical protein
LKPIYVADQKFQNDFATLAIPTGGQRKKIVKYILTRLESQLSGRFCDPETDPASIEHILPENPTQETVNISRPCKTLSLRAGGCKAKAHWNERRNRVTIRTSG